MASVRRFGFTTPMVLDGRTGLLAEGHGRKKATIALRDAGKPDDLPDGAPWPPLGVVVGDDGNWHVPVVHGWASTDDTEARAALLGTNLPGTWDDAMLAQLLGDLAATDSLYATGFVADDLDDVLARLGAGELPEQPTDADHASHHDRADPAPPRSVQGLHEVGLMFQEAAHREYTASVAVLRARWGIDATPLVVLRALRDAVQATEVGP